MTKRINKHMTERMQLTRRAFIQSASALAGLSILNPISQARADKPPLGRVVIVGGGFAGATAAKYIRMWSLGNIETIVIEKSRQFVSCPLSNLVLGGHQSVDDLTFDYTLLTQNHGIQWVQDEMIGIRPQTKKIALKRGELSFDRLILAPGIDFDYRQLPQLLSAESQQLIPHAWKAGWQTVNLRKQLEAMPDGGIFVMSIPKAAYRCPPGPYERACQVAGYLQRHKPKSKVIVLDANGEIVSKKGLFTQVWAEQYPGIVDYRANSEIVRLNVDTKTITTDFEQVKADVLNVIPPQLAGKPAQMANLNNVDNRWCEVDFTTYASVLEPSIHVIGDSISAGLPKSAHMANSQAKVCAAAIVDLMAGNPPNPTPVFANTCYSFVDANQAMHIANLYRYDASKKVMVPAEGGGVSAAPSVNEGEYARAWSANLLADVLT